IMENGYIYIAQPPLFRAKRGKTETYIKDERELDAFLIKRAAEARVVRIPSKGLEISGADLEKLLHRLIAHQKLLQVVERRGHPREIIEALVAVGADREYFADKDKLEQIGSALTTPTRTVTVQRDEARGRAEGPRAQAVEARAAGHHAALDRRARRLLHRRRQERRRREPLQGSRRDESGSALGDDDGSGSAHAAPGARRRSHGSRP